MNDAIHDLGSWVAILAYFLQNKISILMCVPINKQLIRFQRCFCVLSRLSQANGSHYKRRRRQHATYCPRATG